MKLSQAKLIILASILAVITAPLTQAQSSYRLGSGDLISITVFDEEELSMEIRVAETPISYPFLGQVVLAGRSLAEIESQIENGLKGDYLIEPRVSISVIDYRPFFITGEVEKPGGYPYQPGLTLRKAISLSGGFTERASKSKMFVTRGADETRKKMELNDPVSPDDVISIEQSFF